MATSTRTRYAHCGDVDIAYQVLGDRQLDLLLYTGWAIPIECMDDEPAMARFQRRLAEFCRLIRFDTRGVGLSDRGSATDAPSLAQWADDGLCVLDAAGSDKAAVFAAWRHAPVAISLAAANPDRVASLILVNGFAKLLQAPGYEVGVPRSRADEALQMATESDATERGFDALAAFAPSMTDDASFRAWWDRSGNLGTTPVMARALMRQNFEADVRDLLPQVGVPTLVLHRKDVPAPSTECGRYMADRIPGAAYVELPGVDALYWTGDTAAMLSEIEEFLTGVRSGSSAERVLATVLFTDVVDSTTTAAALGDARWRDLLDLHDKAVRRELERFRGEVVTTTGDGFFATFDSPGRAIECALAIRSTLRELKIEVRAGIHTGEIEIRGGDLAGLTVHIGARVMSHASSGEILVSSTVKDLVAGSTFVFQDRGEHELKGVPGAWQLFAIVT